MTREMTTPPLPHARARTRAPKPTVMLAVAATAALLTTSTLSAGLALAPTASAGTYTISGTCGLWTSWANDASRISVYPACPELVARNTGGGSTAPGVGGGWRFDAPAGTAITSVAFQHGLLF